MIEYQENTTGGMGQGINISKDMWQRHMQTCYKHLKIITKFADMTEIKQNYLPFMRMFIHIPEAIGTHQRAQV